MSGLDDITHASKDNAMPVITINVHLTAENNIQIEYPQDKITLEYCAKVLTTAVKVIVENLKERGALKKPDPRVVDKLKNE